MPIHCLNILFELNILFLLPEEAGNEPNKHVFFIPNNSNSNVKLKSAHFNVGELQKNKQFLLHRELQIIALQ